MFPTPLPIDPHLSEIAQALEEHGALVLTAPPGTGKTTRVPGALVDRGLTGEVVVLEPRRLAARAAARRVAAERGGVVGGEVGYSVRHDSAVSKDTRIRFVTEGVLVRQLVADPFLEGWGRSCSTSSTSATWKVIWLWRCCGRCARPCDRS